MPVQLEYSCKIEEVFSGDDLIAMVDLGVENLFKRQRVRLSGVDTPSAIQASGDTEAGKLRSDIRTMVRGRKSKIVVVNKNTNSWVVTLEVEGPTGKINVNDYLIGLGYQFTGKVKP